MNALHYLPLGDLIAAKAWRKLAPQLLFVALVLLFPVGARHVSVKVHIIARIRVILKRFFDQLFAQFSRFVILF